MTQLAANSRSIDAKTGGADAPSWFARLRKNAAARFDLVGYPKSTEEDWRHTSLAPITRTTWKPAEPDDTGRPAALAKEYTLADEAVVEVVMVNGRFAPELSNLGTLARGAVVRGLRQAVAENHPAVEAHLARAAKIESNGLVALNTANFSDGVLLYFPSGTSIDGNIHLLHIATAGAEPAVIHGRLLLVAEDEVHATVVESYAGAGHYWTNAVSEMFLGRNSTIDHCRLQQESHEACHTSMLQVIAGAGSDLVNQSATLGANLTRNELNVLLNGEYAHATLNGLVILDGERHCDNHTLLQHEKANCPSHELYKHVLDGKSSAVFKGKIFVQKDAQKTDSKQTSKSLLLSDDATMNSQPALEIYADDVKCTHGSTTGPVDEDMVFYFRTRGVSLEAARHLLTFAFAADLTRRIRVEPVRRRLENFIAAQHGLPQDMRITDEGSHDLRAL